MIIFIPLLRQNGIRQSVAIGSHKPFQESRQRIAVRENLGAAGWRRQQRSAVFRGGPRRATVRLARWIITAPHKQYRPQRWHRNDMLPPATKPQWLRSELNRFLRIIAGHRLTGRRLTLAHIQFFFVLLSPTFISVNRLLWNLFIYYLLWNRTQGTQ